LFKSEMFHGTGTFKDRGAEVMVALAATLGVDRVVADSSGNAGRAVAACASGAGLGAEIFVPAGTQLDVIDAIERYGARVFAVGNRAEAEAAARARVTESGAWFASHVYQPAFHHGVKTLAFELYEDLQPDGPGTVIVPAGNGTLVLGLWIGFRELAAIGRLPRIPRIVAVQAERCAPLAGLEPRGTTAATGIGIAHPPRAGQVRAAVLATGGRFLVAPEDDLEPARHALEDLGFAGVSISAASVWAALQMGRGVPESGDEPVVVVLSGR
jgi:threonine synthase